MKYFNSQDVFFLSYHFIILSICISFNCAELELQSHRVVLFFLFRYPMGQLMFHIFRPSRDFIFSFLRVTHLKRLRRSEHLTTERHSVHRVIFFAFIFCIFFTLSASSRPCPPMADWRDIFFAFSARSAVKHLSSLFNVAPSTFLRSRPVGTQDEVSGRVYILFHFFRCRSIRHCFSLCGFYFFAFRKNAVF